MRRINYERTAFVPYHERQLKLDRMRQLLTHLGQPDAGMKIVHVAGTKGKGSTSAMIAAMLTAAGYRTGVFSSPHLERIEERFAVDGAPCSADELVALVNRIIPVVRAMDAEAGEPASAGGDEPTSPAGSTYFEITTAIALLHFVERQVDAAVLEVGLGGRLDSTNVCLPAVSVITSISFDHMRQLGNTLAAIAREKAGIIKPGVPVVCGVTDSEPQAVIEQIARDHGCRLIQLGRDFDFQYLRAGSLVSRDAERVSATTAERAIASSRSQGEISFDFTIPGQEYRLDYSPLAMPGRHQAANAAVALATICELRHQGWCISNDAVSLGLSRAALPGRVEVFAGDPMIVVDTAHNPASARALINTLAELPPASRRTLVLSVSHDKDVPAIVRELAHHFDRIIATQYQDNYRAVPADELLQIVCSVCSNGDVQVIMRPVPFDAWQYVRESSIPGERICIAGSFYLAAEMRPLIQAAVASERLNR
ncbi:MAG TPA: folylpolyglutamate synthase/dihydrofolate synthase family protein [Lacipirellulaceae bacterium]|nr:folylpolyglutamate synthase/dihydrofolate synthase family protein [Lacipirellulaceae bacterium]